MEVIRNILLHAGQVIPHQVVMSWLKAYKRPNDKIQGLKAKGCLLPLKRGFYIAGPALTNLKPDPMLVANQLFGPSYVSMDWALSYHGLIPERVFEITSVTTKRSHSLDTVLGVYSYTHLPLPYYSFGLIMHQLSATQNILIASREKALCDKIVTTSGLRLRSIRSAYDFLVENMRMDITALTRFDTNMMQEWLVDYPKRESLRMIIKAIEKLQYEDD